MAARYVVRYGSMRHLADFAGCREPLSRGDRVVVATPRGTEYGEVLCPATARTGELLGRSDGKNRVIRPATDADERAREESWRRAEDAFAGAQKEVAAHGLSMQLVDVEHLLGGERLIFFYTADARVDFRELVKALAKRFRTRIEMRQIGVRDEAKLLADYGDCGKPVCCNTHLTEMPPVSMKMAKLQKASLDPAKISGRCGRLKCCLRYEYDTYEEHRRELPKPGKWVQTKDGKGRVVAQELLAKKLLVAYEDGRRVMIDGADVLTVVSTPKRKSKLRAADPASEGDAAAKPKRKRSRKKKPQLPPE